MSTHELPCADGGDRHCRKTVPVHVKIELTDDEVKELLDGGQIQVTEKKIVDLELDLEDYREALDENGFAWLDSSDVGLESAVCSACGSDQEYDDDGNNITGQ